jgi:hypothetical protein
MYDQATQWDSHWIWPQNILKFRPPSSLDYRTRHGSRQVTKTRCLLSIRHVADEHRTGCLNFSKKPMTQNLDDFIYVVNLPTHLWRGLFIFYTPRLVYSALDKTRLKWSFLTLNFTFFPPSRFFKLTLHFDGLFTMNTMCYGFVSLGPIDFGKGLNHPPSLS